MPEFRFTVTETRTAQVLYMVEAETMNEAREKACTGDTTHTEELQSNGVTCREIEAEYDPAFDD